MKKYLFLIFLVGCGMVLATPHVNAARLWSSGFELNSTTTNVEFVSLNGSTTVQIATVRSGTYAGKTSGLVSGTVEKFQSTFAAANANGPFFFRNYVNFETLPTAENAFMDVMTSGNAGMVWVTVDNTGVLRLHDEDGTIGSPSSALSLGTWYRVEIQIDRTGASGTHTANATLDGVQFAGATNRAFSVGVNKMTYGGNLQAEAQTTGTWYLDDLAINDGTGSSQTSYPGSGKILHLKPNAAGDANAWNNTANAAGSSNNYTLVNEVTPNDATTMVQIGTLSTQDLYNLENGTAGGIGSGDSVTLVQVGGRFRNSTADATTAFSFQIEKTAAGTIASSSAIIPNSTTWRTNTISTVNSLVPPITLYADPDGALWTPSTIDSMQIGEAITAANVNRIQVSTIWAEVEYVPSSAFGATCRIKPEGKITVTVGKVICRQ